MATSKVLPKPVILGLYGSSIRIAHPDISTHPQTQLASTIAAAGTTMTVNDNNGFADNDWLIVGEVGDNTTEEVDVNGAVTRGTSLTVTNSLKLAHEIDSPVNKIFSRAIKIYGAATDGGSGTLIASVDAITTPIADGVMIQWNRPYTEYTLVSTDTAYDYYFVKFTDGTTDSAASDYIPSTGWTASTAITMIDQALDLTDTKFDDKNITLDMCVDWCNEAQTAITQFKYQDPRTGNLKQMDWDFEVAEDTTTVTASTNENEYSLSSVALKYPENDKGIITIRSGANEPFRQIVIAEIDDILDDKPRTDLNGAINAGDTTITVDSNVEFDSSGTLYIGSDTITYTGKSGTTGFTGVPASGTGAITTTHADNSPVWAGVSPGWPEYYCIFNGTLIFDRPFASDYNNYPIKIRHITSLTAISELSDSTTVPFTNVFHLFIASRIERRKGNEEKAAIYMNEFNNQVLNNALASMLPTVDTNRYYEFVSDSSDSEDITV